MPQTDWQIEGSELRVILEDQGQKTKTQLMSLHVSFQYEAGIDFPIFYHLLKKASGDFFYSLKWIITR